MVRVLHIDKFSVIFLYFAFIQRSLYSPLFASRRIRPKWFLVVKSYTDSEENKLASITFSSLYCLIIHVRIIQCIDYSNNKILAFVNKLPSIHRTQVLTSIDSRNSFSPFSPKPFLETMLTFSLNKTLTHICILIINSFCH